MTFLFRPKNLLFSLPSVVFGQENAGFCTGYNDWKITCSLIPHHAKSEQHTAAVSAFLACKNVKGRTDANLEMQYIAARNYWESILREVVEATIILSERGLPFRGSDEIIGSKSNGNYLGLLETIPKFDPFLAQHINHHANRGKGHTSYLSRTICEEFVLLLAEKTLAKIVFELRDARYYSVFCGLKSRYISRRSIDNYCSLCATGRPSGTFLDIH